MSNVNKLFSARLLILTVIAVGLLIVLLTTRVRTSAQTTVNGEEFIFGSVGITPTQTARLNVVNIAADGRSLTRVLKFLDAGGNVIASKTVTLEPGQADFLDLTAAA
jgi:hypothetical protein